MSWTWGVLELISNSFFCFVLLFYGGFVYSPHVTAVLSVPPLYLPAYFPYKNFYFWTIVSNYFSCVV